MEDSETGSSISSEEFDNDQRQARKLRSKTYYYDLETLKSHHRRLFSEQPNFEIYRRYIAGRRSNTSNGLLEAVLRVPANTRNLKQHVAERLLELITAFGNSEPYKTFVTANVVLSKISNENLETYSVFYGQVFSPDETGRLAQEDTSVLSVSLKDLADVEQFFPDEIDLNEIVERFTQLFNDDSGTSVYMVINLIVVFLRFIENTGNERFGRVTNYPRLTQDSYQ